MKRLLLALALCFGFTFAFASGTDVWIASNTATVDTTKVVCPQRSNTKQGHGVISRVCVNTGTAGTYTIYNASAAAVNPIAAIDTAAKGCQAYDVAFSSGLTYTNSAAANVTLMYSCF